MTMNVHPIAERNDPCMSCGANRNEIPPDQCLHKANHISGFEIAIARVERWQTQALEQVERVRDEAVSYRREAEKYRAEVERLSTTIENLSNHERWNDLEAEVDRLQGEVARLLSYQEDWMNDPYRAEVERLRRDWNALRALAWGDGSDQAFRDQTKMLLGEPLETP